jgi:hypothetical protein
MGKRENDFIALAHIGNGSAGLEDHSAAFVAKDDGCVARQEACGAGQVGMADASGLDLNQSFFRTESIEFDIAQLKRAIDRGED